MIHGRELEEEDGEEQDVRYYRSQGSIRSKSRGMGNARRPPPPAAAAAATSSPLHSFSSSPFNPKPSRNGGISHQVAVPTPATSLPTFSSLPLGAVLAVLNRLDMRDRLSASMVCASWNAAACMQEAWVEVDAVEWAKRKVVLLSLPTPLAAAAAPLAANGSIEPSYPAAAAATVGSPADSCHAGFGGREDEEGMESIDGRWSRSGSLSSSHRQQQLQQQPMQGLGAKLQRRSSQDLNLEPALLQGRPPRIMRTISATASLSSSSATASLQSVGDVAVRKAVERGGSSLRGMRTCFVSFAGVASIVLSCGSSLTTLHLHQFMGDFNSAMIAIAGKCRSLRDLLISVCSFVDTATQLHSHPSGELENGISGGGGGVSSGIGMMVRSSSRTSMSTSRQGTSLGFSPSSSSGSLSSLHAAARPASPRKLSASPSLTQHESPPAGAAPAPLAGAKAAAKARPSLSAAALLGLESGCPHLERLKLRGVHVTHAQAERMLRGLTKLKGVDLELGGAWSEGGESTLLSSIFLSLAAHGRAESLLLSSPCPLPDAALVALLSACSHLRDLRLHGERLSRDVFRSFHQLSTLILTSCHLNSQALNALQSAADSWPRLRSLTLESCRRKAVVLAFAAAAPNLRHLSICHSSEEVDDDVIHDITKGCPLLVSLDISFCSGLTSKSLSSIASHLPLLSSLHCLLPPSLILKQGTFSPLSLSSLTGSCRSLRELSMDLPRVPALPISPEGSSALQSWTALPAISSLITLGPSLRSLVLKGDEEADFADINPCIALLAHYCGELESLELKLFENVADWSMEAVSRSCAKLRQLDVDGVNVTRRTLEALAEACPNLHSVVLRSFKFWDARDAIRCFDSFVPTKRLLVSG